MCACGEQNTGAERKCLKHYNIHMAIDAIEVLCTFLKQSHRLKTNNQQICQSKTPKPLKLDTRLRSTTVVP